MATHASAKKRIRQTPRRTEVNRSRLTRVRTSIRKVEEAIGSGDKEKASAALREAQPHMVRGAQRGLVHRNTVSRKLSRLSARIKAM
jgi:small subunit ribosomal protein S20